QALWLPPLGWAHGSFVALALAGCATNTDRAPPPPVSTEVAERVLAAQEAIVNPADPRLQPPSDDVATIAPPSEQSRFTLSDAIAYGLDNNPRLRAASAAILRASGEGQAAFAPFLPQVDFLSQTGVVSSTLAPGVPGNEGFILPSGTGTRSYAQAELGLQWMLYDFGRTGGRYREAIWRQRITELQLVRARQSVEFDVASAYLNVLLANASRRVEEDAVRRAEAILHDTVARSQSGDALREQVLRAEVQLSECRENLIRAREREFDGLAGLNNVMGRNASLPVEVVELELQPPLPGTLADLLSEAAATRPEVRVAQQSIAAAEEGRRVAQADFLPKVFARAAAGRTDGEFVVTGWQQGAGLHIVSPLYDGGKRRGDLRAADGDVQSAVADAQAILDTISLQVNLAYRSVIASRECIELSRTAVSQASENLRILSVKYNNGDATPTDIVDSEAALTRAQQRYYQSTFSYLVALARVDYVTGQSQSALPAGAAAEQAEELPIQFPAPTDTMGPPPRPLSRRLPDVNQSQPPRFHGTDSQ
ncbi:MAG: TolC family protein, partial [Pirellulales bacterium]